MRLTLEETREWFQIRDHVRQALLQLEVCSRCWRVRDLTQLIHIGGYYCCRPDDKDGCLARKSLPRSGLMQ